MSQHQTLTITDALRRNAQTLMIHRHMTPADLGRRMAALGFDGWKHRKTAIRFLAPTKEARKSISPDELIGLALALETTADVLLGSNLAEADAYTIGNLTFPPWRLHRQIHADQTHADPTLHTRHGVRWGADDQPILEDDPDITHLNQILEVLTSAGEATPEEADNLSTAEIVDRVAAMLEPGEHRPDSANIDDAAAQADKLQELRNRVHREDQ